MNRKFATLLATLTFVLTLSLSAQSAPAPGTGAAAAPTTAGGVKIAIIQLREVILMTNEGQRDFGTLQKKYESEQGELNGSRKEVEALQNQLKVQGDKMSADAQANLTKDIQVKEKAMQRKAEDYQNELQQEENTIFERIVQKLQPVIEKYANENGYSLVLNASQGGADVVYATQAVNISKGVLDAYNTVSGVPAQPKAATGAAAPAATKPAAKPAATGTKPQGN